MNNHDDYFAELGGADEHTDEVPSASEDTSTVDITPIAEKVLEVLEHHGSVRHEINPNATRRLAVFCGWHHGDADMIDDLVASDEYRKSFVIHQNTIMRTWKAVVDALGIEYMHLFLEPLNIDPATIRGQVKGILQKPDNEVICDIYERNDDLAAKSVQGLQQKKMGSQFFYDMQADERIVQESVRQGINTENQIHGLTSDLRAQEPGAHNPYEEIIQRNLQTLLLLSAEIKEAIGNMMINFSEFNIATKSHFTRKVPSGSVSFILAGKGHSRYHNFGDAYFDAAVANMKIETVFEENPDLRDTRFIAFDPAGSDPGTIGRTIHS